MSFPYNFRALPFWHTLESDGEESEREENVFVEGFFLSLHVGGRFSRDEHV